MGSSLTVTPAADVPKLAKSLVIVNLQKTPLDKIAYIKVNALCDDFMKRLAKKLELKVEQFVLSRLIEFKKNKENDILFRGIDRRGVPFSFFKEVGVSYDNEKAYKKLKGEPFKVSLQKKDKMKLKFEFYGWLKEPEYVMEI